MAKPTPGTHVNNRIPDLVRLISNTPTAAFKARQDVAEKIGRRMLTTLKSKAAEMHDGSKWTEPDYRTLAGVTVSHGRPSLRLHGSTLESKWASQPFIALQSYDTTVVKIYSYAPHMQLLLDGSPQHGIPLHTPGPLSFWWIRRNKKFFGSFTTHPGFAPSTLPEKAAEASRSENQHDLMEGTRSIFSPLRSFFSERAT